MTPVVRATAGAAPVHGAAPAADRADAPLDDTAETERDGAVSLAAAVARRAELSALATQGRQQELQSRLDRMRAEFNAKQERRSERLREMNMLRDMAMEQAKADDEILKKYIAMI